MKQRLLNIVHSPVRGTQNLVRLFRTGVMTVHTATLFVAMVIHLLQLRISALANLYYVTLFKLSRHWQKTCCHMRGCLASCITRSYIIHKTKSWVVNGSVRGARRLHDVINSANSYVRTMSHTYILFCTYAQMPMQTIASDAMISSCAHYRSIIYNELYMIEFSRS